MAVWVSGGGEWVSGWVDAVSSICISEPPVSSIWIRAAYVLHL